jgi:hypothetical protein
MLKRICLLRSALPSIPPWHWKPLEPWPPSDSDIQRVKRITLKIGRLYQWNYLYWVLLSLIFVATATLRIALPSLRIEPFYALIAAAVAALIQLISNSGQSISRAEESAINFGVELLHEAYDLLQSDVREKAGNRLAWLTAARNIATSQMITDEIRDPTRKCIAKEKEHLYRIKLRELLWPLGGEHLLSDYFAESPDVQRDIARIGHKRLPIAISSICQLYRFTQWPADRPDPLPDVQAFTREEIRKMILFGPRELGRFLRKAQFPDDDIFDFMDYVDDGSD